MAARYDTAGSIINDAAVEIGLAAVTDPFASSDPNFITLCRLLKSVGRKIALARDWSNLEKEHTITCDGITNKYDLPADFVRMVPQSGWDRTSDEPLGGPLSADQWECLASTSLSGAVRIYARFTADQVWFWGPTGANPIAAGTVIVFQYQSRLWVKPTGETSATQDAPSASTDTIMFDPILMVAALELAWAKAKGFDTTEAKTEFVQVWSSVAGNDSPGAVLHLTGPAIGVHFLDQSNVPDTGYGV